MTPVARFEPATTSPRAALGRACSLVVLLARGPARFDLVLSALWLVLCGAARADAQAHAKESVSTAISYSSTESESEVAADNLGKGETLRAGEREHDGFFLRMSAGPGAGRTRYEERVDGTRVSEVQSSGLTGIIEVAAGGRAVGNLILHGTAIYTRYDSPTRTVDGVKDAGLHVKASAVMLGGGLTYYLMPYNVFVSGSAGPAWQIEERRGGHVTSNTGFFVSLAAGKEWWVGGSGNWGLGAALRGTFAASQLDLAGVRSAARLGSLGLAFCATFN